MMRVPPSRGTGGREAAGGDWLKDLPQRSNLWITLVLVATIAVFSVLRPEAFLSLQNFRNVTTDASVLLLLSVGMTFVITTAGIDLSVGSVLVFAGVVAAKYWAGREAGGPAVILIGLLVALVAGLSWGVLNGVLVAKAKLPSLIVTLGTTGMALGAALIIAKGVDQTSVPLQLIETVGSADLLGVLPYLVVIAGAVAVVGWVALSMTRFGLWTAAIGSNLSAARRAGINVDRHLIKVYALTGLLAGLAGFLSIARFGTTTIDGNATANLAAITAVVIGGTSLFGGIGRMGGTVVGVFIPAILQNGFTILGVQPFWQQVVVGAILILAVYVDQLKRRARE